MKYQHIIWDFDGTLCDTYPAMARAFQDALHHHGADAPIPRIREVMQQTLLGDCIRIFARQHELDLPSFRDRFLDNYEAIPLADQPPYPGVVAILERVLDHGGHNFIFTHRGCKSLTEALRVHDLERCFTEALSTEDGYARKPDPAAFNHLIDRYALPREKTLGLGDRDLDILAGTNAGVDTCLFEAQPGEDAPPTYVIDEYRQLAAILNTDEK